MKLKELKEQSTKHSETIKNFFHKKTPFNFLFAQLLYYF
ncbi:hypothetical protein AB434_1622 [Heyndrickxia coagulans]|uniref:Uncharacterized protein n=1 Tax=Heyndrickxia coagulans TaxID=1398 RepID=A0AAN0TAW7_HEYCO|nr:hypothetical protein SB48_HM08orf05918 [Heyndrickxia coagulans]AKN54027.1 hypothetical protein AB434_1622 [Heyndrickxia coagulans]